jgi:hypothetical protein
MNGYIHRLLCFLRIRNEFDYQPPCFTPNEPHHQYERRITYRPGPDNNRKTDIPVGECCDRCGGGRLHEVHEPPWHVDDTRGMREGVGMKAHPFELGDTGYCAKCGAGKFYPVHTRAALASTSDSNAEMQGR